MGCSALKGGKKAMGSMAGKLAKEAAGQLAKEAGVDIPEVPDAEGVQRAGIAGAGDKLEDATGNKMVGQMGEAALEHAAEDGLDGAGDKMQEAAADAAGNQIEQAVDNAIE